MPLCLDWTKPRRRKIFFMFTLCLTRPSFLFISSIAVYSVLYSASCGYEGSRSPLRGGFSSGGTNRRLRKKTLLLLNGRGLVTPKPSLVFDEWMWRKRIGCSAAFVVDASDAFLSTWTLPKMAPFSQLTVLGNEYQEQTLKNFFG